MGPHFVGLHLNHALRPRTLSTFQDLMYDLTKDQYIVPIIFMTLLFAFASNVNANVNAFTSTSIYICTRRCSQQAKQTGRTCVGKAGRAQQPRYLDLRNLLHLHRPQLRSEGLCVIFSFPTISPIPQIQQLIAITCIFGKHAKYRGDKIHVYNMDWCRVLR